MILGRIFDSDKAPSTFCQERMKNSEIWIDIEIKCK
jgi:hypothetical protein